MRPSREVFPSVILAVRDCVGSLGQYLDNLAKILADNFDHYEVIIVDDASIDDTVSIVEERQKHLPNLTLYSLPKTYGNSVATVAGLDHAIGDFIIILNPNRDQPEIIVDLVQKALEGSDIVYALPRDRIENIGLYNRMRIRVLGSLARYNRIDLPATMSSTMLISRAVLSFILKAADRHRILHIAPALSGYRYKTIIYDRNARGATTSQRMGWRESTAEALNLMFAISPRPLRFIALFSLAVSAITVFYSAFVVLYWFFADDLARGWASMSLQISGLFFLLSLVLAAMSEYLQQILDSTERRPLYYIARQSNSDVMDYAPDLNVIGGGGGTIDFMPQEDRSRA